MIDNEKNEEQILAEPQLVHAGTTKPSQTEADLHEGENNEWFASGSNDIYVADYTGPKPEMDQSKEYSFSDLVDIELLQKLFTSYYMITKIPNAILDADNNILFGLGWQDICTQFHRVCPETLQRCFQSDSYISEHLMDSAYVGYRCLNGLMDYATPIIIEGRHLATIFLGQFIHEPPDEDFFRQQAQEYGFDEAAYMEALRRVPIISEDKIKPIMEFYSQLGQLLTIVGLDKIRQKESEDRYRTIFENTGTAMTVIEEDMTISLANTEAERIFGYSRAEVEGKKKWTDFVAPDDLERMEEYHRRRRIDPAGAPTGYEFNLIDKQGAVRNISAGISIIPETKKSVASLLDVTERKLVEERLKEKDQFTESIVQGSAVALFVINPEHQVIYWNKACEDLTGIKPEDILGTNEQWKAFYDHPRPCTADIIIDNKFDEMTNFYPDYAKSVLIPDGIRAEGWYPNLGGKNRYIVFDAAPIHDAHGKILAAIETLQDITERKRAEEDLRESQEYTKVLFTSSHIPHIVGDAETGRFIDCNAAAAKIAGYATREELLGKTVLDVSAPIQYNGLDSATEARKNDQACRENGSHIFEWRSQRPNGQIWDAEIHLMPFQHRGKSLVQFTLQDITESKKAEQALRESEIKFRTLFDSAFDSIFLVDQYRFIDCNQKTLEIFGCTREQIIGQPPYRFSPEVQSDGRNSLEKAQEKMDAALRGQPQFFEWKHCRYDGTLFDAEVSLNVFSTAGKNYLQGLVHDITERKEAERKLQETNAKLFSSVKELEERSAEMSQLGEMGEQLQSCQTIEEACAISAQYLQELMPADQGAIYLISPAKDQAEAVNMWGDAASMEKTFTPLDCWAIRRGRSHLVDDAHPGLLCGHITGSPAGQYLCVPMMAHGEMLGILHLNHPAPEQDQQKSMDRLYSEHKTQLALAVADHIALTLSNLKLQKTLRQ